MSLGELQAFVPLLVSPDHQHHWDTAIPLALCIGNVLKAHRHAKRHQTSAAPIAAAFWSLDKAALII